MILARVPCYQTKTLNFLYIKENIAFLIKASVQVQFENYIITYTEIMNYKLKEIKETGSPSNISCQILVCQFDV